MRAQERFEITYKRRTYTNISLPGIFGLEFWKEHPVNEADTEQPYKMITLLSPCFSIPPDACQFEHKTQGFKAKVNNKIFELAEVVNMPAEETSP